jgi:MoaA/NifB/PqqE/SkfB family radical SAM enzyme
MDEKWDIEAMIKTLNQTDQKWCIGITGGEPFAYPQFVNICEKFVHNDITLYIDTNLSIEKHVLEFAERIPSSMVEDMYISLHIEERERRNGVDSFIRMIDVLREKSFPFQVNYVLDPRLLHRFEKDFEFFRSKGITLLAKPYKGIYRFKPYPESYTRKQRELILKSSPDAFRRTLFYPGGIKCEAGKSLVRITSDGTVTRCVSDHTPLGNIYSGLTLLKESTPCNAPFCSCFGWDLIDDKDKKELVKNGLADKIAIKPLLRRYAGYYVRVVKEFLRK